VPNIIKTTHCLTAMSTKDHLIKLTMWWQGPKNFEMTGQRGRPSPLLPRQFRHWTPLRRGGLITLPVLNQEHPLTQHVTSEIIPFKPVATGGIGRQCLSNFCASQILLCPEKFVLNI